MQTCVLLSIKPEFVEKIFQGDKKYEFRRKLFKSTSVTKVVIYASSPVKKVVGEFEIDDILSLDINQLWSKTSQHAGIDKEFYDSYFHGKMIGHAIRIKNVQRYSEPLELNSYNIQRAPQSFLYLSQ
jgi:predicted transcriptional regulator